MPIRKQLLLLIMVPSHACLGVFLQGKACAFVKITAAYFYRCFSEEDPLEKYQSSARYYYSTRKKSSFLLCLTYLHAADCAVWVLFVLRVND